MSEMFFLMSVGLDKVKLNKQVDEGDDGFDSI
jgi:hypothetical protein